MMYLYLVPQSVLPKKVTHTHTEDRWSTPSQETYGCQPRGGLGVIESVGSPIETMDFVALRLECMVYRRRTNARKNQPERDLKIQLARNEKMASKKSTICV
jgi:hypothetical protein